MKPMILASMVALATLTSTGCALQGGMGHDESGMGQRSMMGQGSTGQEADDATLTRQVKARLAEEPGMSALQVDVKTINGTVQLSGFAATQAEKDKAGELARSVPEVKGVRNNVTVQVDRD